MERREVGRGTWRELDLRPCGGDGVDLVFRARVKGALPPTVEEATTQGADPRVSFDLAVHPRRRIPRRRFRVVRLRQVPPHPLPSTARASSGRAWCG
jgi:hypothetical protein